MSALKCKREQKDGSITATKKMKRTAPKRSSVTGLISPALRKLVSTLQELPKQAYQGFAPLVEHVIDNKSRDIQQIEHLLDSILDLCYDDKMLGLFKRLCRHYYYIDPAATADYVYAYREMWDEKSLSNDNVKSGMSTQKTFQKVCSTNKEQ